MWKVIRIDRKMRRPKTDPWVTPAETGGSEVSVAYECPVK